MAADLSRRQRTETRTTDSRLCPHPTLVHAPHLDTVPELVNMHIIRTSRSDNRQRDGGRSAAEGSTKEPEAARAREKVVTGSGKTRHGRHHTKASPGGLSAGQRPMQRTGAGTTDGYPRRRRDAPAPQLAEREGVAAGSPRRQRTVTGTTPCPHPNLLHPPVGPPSKVRKTFLLGPGGIVTSGNVAGARRPRTG